MGKKDIDKVSCRPDFAVMLYSGYFKVKEELSPTIRVTAAAPPLLLVHASDVGFHRKERKMDRDDVKKVVGVTLLTLTRITKRTRTQADDLMASILQANESRLVDAIVKLLESPDQPPTEEQVVAALKSVGMHM